MADGSKTMRSERLRSAVLDKNFYWFNRYRVTDGYSTYGDRAFLKFSEGPGGYGEGLSNYDVVQRELEILDLMTANRDKVVWAVAQGKRRQAGRHEPAASSFPSSRNKPGPLPGGKHLFLGGEEAIEQDDRRPRTEGQAVRLGGDVPRAGQPGADGVRHQGPAVGRRLADLSALEADRADERQAADSRRHQRRRQSRQMHDVSPTTCTTRPASSSGTAA